MESCHPKPKTAIGGRQAKIFETQVLVARFRLPCERVADDRRKDILDLCSVFPVLCLFRKITPFLPVIPVRVFPRSGTFGDV